MDSELREHCHCKIAAWFRSQLRDRSEFQGSSSGHNEAQCDEFTVLLEHHIAHGGPQSALGSKDKRSNQQQVACRTRNSGVTRKRFLEQEQKRILEYVGWESEVSQITVVNDPEHIWSEVYVPWMADPAHDATPAEIDPSTGRVLQDWIPTLLPAQARSTVTIFGSKSPMTGSVPFTDSAGMFSTTDVDGCAMADHDPGDMISEGFTRDGPRSGLFDNETRHVRVIGSALASFMATAIDVAALLLQLTVAVFIHFVSIVFTDTVPRWLRDVSYTNAIWT